MAFLSEKTANEQSGFEADLSSVWKQDDIKGFCLLSKTVFDQITEVWAGSESNLPTLSIHEPKGSFIVIFNAIFGTFQTGFLMK